MMSFKVCSRCEHCIDVDYGEVDDEGEVARLPAVECALAPTIVLTLSDDPPDDCPNGVLHMTEMDGMLPGMARRLSGKPARPKRRLA